MLTNFYDSLYNPITGNHLTPAGSVLNLSPPFADTRHTRPPIRLTLIQYPLLPPGTHRPLSWHSSTATAQELPPASFPLKEHPIRRLGLNSYARNQEHLRLCKFYDYHPNTKIIKETPAPTRQGVWIFLKDRYYFYPTDTPEAKRRTAIRLYRNEATPKTIHTTRLIALGEKLYKKHLTQPAPTA